MRFKLHYLNETQEVTLTAAWDDFDDVILPPNPKQYIYFPVPKNMLKKVREYLMDKVLTKSYKEDFANAKDKSQFMTDLRKELNPKIMDALYQFREENAELFI